MNLAAIDLNLLWVLHTVIETRSVALAAKRLRVTAPAVSNALARLRALLGDPLFVRRGRGLVATPRALALGPALARGFGELAASFDAGELDAKTSTRELTLAISDADQIASLSRIARLFSQRLPRARLRIVSVDTLMASGGLAGEEVDLAIGPPLDGEHLHRCPLYVEEGVLIARRGHPRVRRTLSVAQFNAERHVDIHLLLGRAGAGNQAVREAMAAAGLHRNIAMTVPTFVAAASVVAGTDLLSGMPRRVVGALAPAFPLQVLRGPGPPFQFELALHWHERTARDPGVEAFRDIVREAFGAPRPAAASARAMRRATKRTITPAARPRGRA